MRICDLCRNEKAETIQQFEAEFNGVTFVLSVKARLKETPMPEYYAGMGPEICPDCAAKGALMVLGAVEPKEKPANG